MYYQITEALKRRFISELRGFWATHPKYTDLVDNIQGKYSFSVRPQTGIIVKTSGATRVDMAPDNFIGTVRSYTYLARVPKFPGTFLEWVREDSIAIQNNGGNFPSLPGVYFIELTKHDDVDGAGEFYVDRLLEVTNESVAMVTPKEGQLQRIPLQGTLSLYQYPSGRRLVDGAEYEFDSASGSFTLLDKLDKGQSISADYRYPAESTGPHPFNEMYANKDAIPGVVLAFGRSVKQGDRVAVVVQKRRSDAYLEYGGRWSITLDFDIISRDVFSQQEIADRTIVWIYGNMRPRVSQEGVEILDVSLGGEMEEIYDENGDDYFYNASFSVTCETEWSMHVPLGPALRTVEVATQAQLAAAAENPGMYSEGTLSSGLGIQRVQDPFLVGRTRSFEVIR